MVSARESQLLGELTEIRYHDECRSAAGRLWELITTEDRTGGRETDADLTGEIALSKIDADLITDYICYLENKVA